MKVILSIIIVSFLFGCESMPKKCRAAVGEGAFRYGTLTQKVEAEGVVVSISEKGNGCEGKKIEIEKDGAKVKIE